MNKSEFIAAVADKAQVKSKKEVADVIDAFLGTVTEALKKGDEVRLVGFGTFLSKKSEAREGRNPRTGEPIKIPASVSAKFKPGKGLKDELNK